MAQTKLSIWKRAFRAFGPGNPIESLDIDKVWPSQAELNEDADLNRTLARQFADDFTRASAANTQIVTDQAKWLGATLTTINLGGLFAPLQFQGSDLFQGLALGAFVLGICSSLLGAHLSIRRGLGISLTIGEIQGYWRAVEHNGYRIRDTEVKIGRLAPEALRSSTGSYLAGYFSLVCFLLGTLSTGIAFLGAT